MICFRVGVWIGTLVTLLAVCPAAQGQLFDLVSPFLPVFELPEGEGCLSPPLDRRMQCDLSDPLFPSERYTV